MNAGKAVPDNLVNQAVLLVSSRAVCKARGWVLDGYPQTKGQALELEKSGLVPQIIVQITAPDADIQSRTKQDHELDIKLKNRTYLT